MPDATSASTTIRPEEAAHFAALAADWWNPAGSSAMLHRLNPVRLGFLRAAIDRHWGTDPQGLRPLAGKRALDVGCGAGLLCEPLARLSAEVTGVDAAPANVEAAALHARGSGLEISYRHGELGTLGLGPFDLVTCLEVLEHVADKAAFVTELARHLAPGGLLVLSTPNRTTASRLLLIDAAETLGRIPRGTHRWEDFVSPEDLRDLLAAAGLTMAEPQGIAWSAARGLHLSGDLSLDYIVTAVRA
jgi:2-polyprenyl-6-hydroxyphenyl methylase/3-demethylubiquinone-9 3-methyltransferase